GRRRTRSSRPRNPRWRHGCTASCTPSRATWTTRATGIARPTARFPVPRLCSRRSPRPGARSSTPSDQLQGDPMLAIWVKVRVKPTERQRFLKAIEHDAIAFQLGPLEIRWYGILTAASIALGLWLADRQARAENLPAEEISRCAWWAVVTGYLGARLYEVAFNWDYYGRNPWKILAVWEGGLAIHGGFIVGGLVGAWLATRRGLPVLRSLDVAAPSLAIAQAIGRWGNFFNE